MTDVPPARTARLVCISLSWARGGRYRTRGVRQPNGAPSAPADAYIARQVFLSLGTGDVPHVDSAGSHAESLLPTPWATAEAVAVPHRTSARALLGRRALRFRVLRPGPALGPPGPSGSALCARAASSARALRLLRPRHHPAAGRSITNVVPCGLDASMRTSPPLARASSLATVSPIPVPPGWPDRRERAGSAR